MYIIDRTNLKKEKAVHKSCFLWGLFFLIICSYAIIAQGFFDVDLGGDYAIKNNPIVFLFFVVLLCGTFICIGWRGIKRADEKMKKYDYLEKNGKLIKGLTYRMVPTSFENDYFSTMAIEIEYQLESGSVVTLRGDDRFDGKCGDADGKVDLLIDPKDPNNYYIDFEIIEYYENNPIK